MEEHIPYEASAPGKLILFGEHSAVYGEPAIAVALNLRAYARGHQSENNTNTIKSLNLDLEFSWEKSQNVTSSDIPQLYPFVFAVNLIRRKFKKEDICVQIEISSEIPIGIGLGSSAAVSLAVIGVVSQILNVKLSPEDFLDLSLEVEKISHARPSGIDTSTSLYGSFIYFKKGTIVPHNIEFQLPLIICNSKIRRSTRAVVADVKRLRDKYPELIDPVIQTMGELANEGLASIIEMDYNRVGELMNLNQKFLDVLGVGHFAITDICTTALKNGAIGAKITGAGRGGSAILLCPNQEVSNNVAKSLQEKNYQIIQAEISQIGVEMETLF